MLLFANHKTAWRVLLGLLLGNLLVVNNNWGQAAWFPGGYGAQVGLCVELGTHRVRIGGVARFYTHWEHVQVNIEFGGLYNACSFGTDGRSFEGQLKFGLVGAWGKKDSLLSNPFVGAVEQQTKRPYALAYGYNFYWDNQATSQATGSFGIQVHTVRLVMENDFLAFLQEDKYRTGAIGLYYQRGAWQLALQQISWTADPYGDDTYTVHDSPTYTKDCAKYGYRDLQHESYCDKSVGVLRFRALHHTGALGQILGAHLGLDAEQIRHALQNKLIHDSFLLENPHIPMIDREGEAFLFQEGQQIRTPRYHGGFSINPTTFY
jgi:hypothetical protein